MTDHMQDWLDSQSELQHKMPSPHPTSLYMNALEAPSGPDGDDARMAAIEFIQWNNKAIIHELVELESETGWKPWAKSRHINFEAARGELIDVMHFVANVALVLGMDDAAEIMFRYHAKHEKNAKRQEEGYDGVSTKCPNCKRALDDEAVDCYEVLTSAQAEELGIGISTFDPTKRVFYCSFDNLVVSA